MLLAEGGGHAGSDPFCSVQGDGWAQWETAVMCGRNGACRTLVLLCEVYTWEYGQ